MLVLDTDLLTVVQRAAGSPEHLRLSERLRLSGDAVYTTIISYEEQMRGWTAYIRRARPGAMRVEAYSRLHALVVDFRTRPILEYTAAAESAFAGLEKARLRVGTMDLRIAAICLANGAKLVTRNIQDFDKVPGLKAEDWTR